MQIKHLFRLVNAVKFFDSFDMYLGKNLLKYPESAKKTNMMVYLHSKYLSI